MARALFVAVLALSLGSASSREQVALTTKSRQEALMQEWSMDLSSQRHMTNPVKRVVTLLQKMKAELDAEASKESEMYDKMVCWCETGEKEKTKAIADAEEKEKDLESEIESRAAQIGERDAEINSLKDQLAEDKKALKEATALREKESSEFRDEEKDMVQAITNLKNAIRILGRHQGGSFLQYESATLVSLKALLRDAAMKYQMLLGDKPNKQHLSLLSVSAGQGAQNSLFDVLDGADDNSAEDLPLKWAEQVVTKALGVAPSGNGAFLQANSRQGKPASYSAQSDGIFGILTQMLEEFEATLKKSQSNEVKAAKDYEALAASKEEQISTAAEKLDAVEGAHAKNRKALSDAKEDLEATREQRSADIKYLRNLKSTCRDLDKQWEARSNMRAEESKAVQEAIVILTEDDNRETMARSTFLQLESSSRTSMKALRARAAERLRSAARDPAFDADDLLAAWHSRSGHGGHALASATAPRMQLSTLAVTVQLDAFSKVKELMDKMVAELKKQQQEEAELKAYCTKELNDNEKATFEKNEEKKDLDLKIQQLDDLVEKLNKEIDAAKDQIAETRENIKAASQSREKENAEFQTLIADQRATQEILKQALTRLQKFYKASFAQQTPPVQFNDYQKNAGASPVMGLIESVIEDSKALAKEATADEYKAQADYETNVKDSNEVIATNSDAITTKTKAIAEAKQDHAAASDDLESAVGELESLKEYEADLHGQCDFTLKNFDVRQKARLQEMEAIQEAKGILSGAQ